MKERILQTASQMFLTQGFKNTTMDDIAREMGISKKTLYKLFKTKEDLVKETALYVFGYIYKNIDHIKQQNLNPIEEFFQIRKFIKESIKTTSFSPYTQLKKYYPDVADILLKLKKQHVMRSIEENLKRGIEEGIYKKNLDINFMKRWYFGNVYLLISEENFPSEEFDRRKISNTFIKIFLNTITNKKGKSVLKQLKKTYGI